MPSKCWKFFNFATMPIRMGLVPYFFDYVCSMHSKNRCLLAFILAIFSIGFTHAQDTYLPLNSYIYYHTDRQDVAESSPQNFSALKPYLRSNIYYTIRHNTPSGCLNKRAYTQRYFMAENFEFLSKPLLANDSISGWVAFKKRIYSVPSAMYSVITKDFFLSVNPIIGFSYGSDSSGPTMQNTRGIEVRGSIDKKVGFYSAITENQWRFPKYYRQQIDSTGIIPGIGFHKNFKGNAHDFFLARGYLTFSPTKHIGMQFGHDQNFIGNGYRSLILSDFSNPYLFLKINTKIWRFNYQNLFSQLADFSFQSGNGSGMKPKYFVNHYLGIKLLKNLELGFFESVIYDRGDTNKSGSFDLNYLNPIIFYRAIEHNLNSSDNVIVGLDFKWNIKQKFSFYGQFVLDEFKKDSLLKRTGWWANKFGVQAGVKYINAFTLKGLDLQAEFNSVRPYTYTHFKKSQNYVNYNQALAHPFGANFKELVLVGRYHPFFKLFIEGGYIKVIKGLDSTSRTKQFGGNILDTYLNRPYESGHKIGQGVKTNYSIAFVSVSYRLAHNFWLDARANFRHVSSKLLSFESQSNWYQIGARFNFNMRNYDF